MTTLRLFLVLTGLTGLLYPGVTTLVGWWLFPSKAGGSLVRAADGQVRGSELLAQKTRDPRHFWPRPSAVDYATVPSGASQLAPTSTVLHETASRRATEWREAHGLAAGAPIPADLLFASGSGLDPHISPEAARLQIVRVATARGVAPSVVQTEVDKRIERGGLLGEDRVNCLLLNLALDALP